MRGRGLREKIDEATHAFAFSLHRSIAPLTPTLSPQGRGGTKKRALMGPFFRQSFGIFNSYSFGGVASIR